MIDLKIHIVQKGDTLWEIAKQYGVDFEEIKQLNSQLSSPDMIMPGMKVKIPSSTKAVKKESMKPKEEQKPSIKKPYKDISPKPVPMIKEDDHKKPKEVKVEIPQKTMPQVPEMPLKPMPQAPQVPEMPQMPMQQVIEQEQYTTINFPEMPIYPKPMAEMPEKEHPIPMPMPQQPVQVVPVCCCHMVHPCCHGMHHGPDLMGQMHGGFEPQHQHPMHHQQMMHPNNFENVNHPQPSPCMETPMQFHYQHHQHPMHAEQTMHPNHFGNMKHDWASPNVEMPVKPMQPANEEDCGCHQAVHPPHPMGHHMPPFATEGVQQYPAYPEFNAQQMQPNHLYPPQFREAPLQTNNLYPTPPGFSDYNYQENEDESKGE